MAMPTLFLANILFFCYFLWISLERLNIISSVTCLSFIIIDIPTIVSLPIVSLIYGSCTRSLLMRKQCLMFVNVSRIYGRLFFYLMNSKSDATCTRTYFLMGKQCLMFMLLLAGSEQAEIKSIANKIFEKILLSRTNLLFGPSPDRFPCDRTSVVCRITTYFHLTCPFAVWVFTLEPRQL